VQESDDLWPAELTNDLPRTPTLILRELATALGVRTNNVVQAKLKTTTNRDSHFRIQFVLHTPALDGYEYTLFQVWHSPTLYPVEFNEQQLKDEDSFRDAPREFLRSEKTMGIVRALISQARATDTDTD
jgi:hypothetical protein